MVINLIPGQLYKLTPASRLLNSRVITEPFKFIIEKNILHLLFLEEQEVFTFKERKKFIFLNTIGNLYILYESQLEYFNFELVLK